MTDSEGQTAEASDDVRRETTPAVLTALRDLERPKTNWQQGLLLLAASGALFVWTQDFRGTRSWLEIALLLVVLLLHELGHLAAMRLFGYRDLRIFFLPFFGAAASGRKLHADATQRALVSLAGPLPSILLAVVLWVGAAVSGTPVDLSSDEPFSRFLLLLFVINLLNLLPIEPLDGGAFLRVVLMARVPLLQVGFRVMAGIALAGLAWFFRDWIWGGLAAFLLISCPHQYALSRSARRLREELDHAGVRSVSEEIPEEQLEVVARRVRLDLSATEPRAVAGSMQSLWQQAHERSPRWAATAALLALYGVFAVPPAVLLLVVATQPAAAANDDMDDDPIQSLGPEDPLLPGIVAAQRLELPPGWRPRLAVFGGGLDEPIVHYAAEDHSLLRVSIERRSDADASSMDLAAALVLVRGLVAEDGLTPLDLAVPGAFSFPGLSPNTTVTVLDTGEVTFVLELEVSGDADPVQVRGRTRELLAGLKVR